MTQILPWGSLGAVSKEEDLRPTCGFSINLPPEDGCCNVCGRHMSELKPFGGPGDPLVGDFAGELLVKTYRPDGPYDEEAVKAWEEAEEATKGAPGTEDLLPWFIEKYGQEKGKRLYGAGMLCGSFGASWECRDCIILNEDEYFEKYYQPYQKDWNARP